MIPAARVVKIGAVASALAIHSALGWALMARTDVQVDGSAGAAEARLGTRFAEMAAGTLKAENSTETLTPMPPKDARENPEDLESVPPAPQAQADATKVPVIEPDAPTRALEADAVPTITALSAPSPAKLLTPQPEATALSSMTPENIIKAEEDSANALTRSLRPQPRSEAFEAEHKKAAAPEPAKPAKPQPKPKSAAAAQGNSNQNARAGAATGTNTATAASAGTVQGQSNTAGNAAASNYPGLVMQKISRVPRPRSNTTGTAVISFSIASSGALAGLSVAQSSGSARLDQAAAQMIQRAAPFPPPPTGARRSFSISIKGR
ncbi:TonB family protein [Roseovarius sp. LXJ103]|uniref:cell envelope integrity protein TolA n=1 Tax=Roseovarius carneus TaxID=2853164 RepID=UPI000D60DCFD|nr:cell envelope integrity protein TolA [Roseovarius carneus]MBZ8119761.1 TonB family protein [Roseovarius carneus]PWE34635.1 energy transducer TonB [Pelagicola sp. LXJ1103]